MTSLRHDVITSRRSFRVESMALYLLHVWCEFGDNRTRNTVTALQIASFCQKMTSLRHDVITSRRSLWVQSMPVCLLHVWYEFGHNQIRNMVTAGLNRNFCQNFDTFSQISRERLGRFSIRKLHLKGLVEAVRLLRH